MWSGCPGRFASQDFSFLKKKDFSEAPRGPGGSHAFAAFSTPGGFLVALAWRQARERGILDVWIPDLTLTSLLAMRGRERGARSEGEHRTRHSHTHNHTHRQTRL